MLLVRTYLDHSGIQGIGCFAAQDIKKGTAMWRFMPGFDVLLSTHYISQFDPEFISRYTQECALTGMRLLCVDNARFFNHSDNPNIGSSMPLFDPRKTDDALRDIRKGEEIVQDYRIGDEHPFAGFPEQHLSDRDLASELRKVADKLRYEHLLIGENREPELIRAAADRIAAQALPF